MNHIAHIEGLQDNILSNLSDSHLLKIRTFSNHWIKPSHTVINTRLESYIQKFKKLVGYIPTSPHDDLDATPKIKQVMLGIGHDGLTTPSTSSTEPDLLDDHYPIVPAKSLKTPIHLLHQHSCLIQTSQDDMRRLLSLI